MANPNDVTDDASLLQRAGWTSREVAGERWWRMPMLRWVRWWSEREAARIVRVQAANAAEREAQRRSFAYGNVAVGNPNVTRAMVDAAADRMAAEAAEVP
jgi:hypothetical protein